MPSHWIQLVRSRHSVGWEPPEPPEPVPWPSPKHTGGNVKFDDGKPIEMPPPRPCAWCGRIARAEIVERWEARSFREAIWGPGEHYSWDKPYKAPLKCIVIGYPCVCLEKPPYAHWILAVRLKKTPGWDLAAV